MNLNPLNIKLPELNLPKVSIPKVGIPGVKTPEPRSAGLVACGVLIGAVGVKVLKSRPVRSMFTCAAAGVLRVREGILTTATRFREHTEDILADAKDINSVYQADSSDDGADSADSTTDDDTE